MSDDALRWFIAIGVVIVTLSVLGLMAILIVLFRIAKDVRSKITGLVDRAGPVLEQAAVALAENKSNISVITAETAAITANARKSAERIDDLLTDSAPRWKARISQLDKILGANAIRIGGFIVYVLRIVKVVAGAGASVASLVKVIKSRNTSGGHVRRLIAPIVR